MLADWVGTCLLASWWAHTGIRRREAEIVVEDACATLRLVELAASWQVTDVGASPYSAYYMMASAARQHADLPRSHSSI